MKKQAQKDTTPKKDEATVDVDPVADFNQNCKNHLNDKTKSIKREIILIFKEIILFNKIYFIYIT